MAEYVSEHTTFMREWLKKNPLELAEQKAGRALWWTERPRTEEDVKRLDEARVPRKAYYYDAN
jgi:hypothetical protein